MQLKGGVQGLTRPLGGYHPALRDALNVVPYYI